MTELQGTPTMRGEFCFARGKNGETCIFGRGHEVTHHLLPETDSGQPVRWEGPVPLQGDRIDNRDDESCDFFCHIHGWVTVEWHNPELRFMDDHKACVPRLETLEDAVRTLQNLAGEREDVGVFWDKGWGDAPLEICIIVDGNGQNPRAFLTPQVYESLQVFDHIAPNSLSTYKARRFHEFIVPEAATPGETR